MERELRIDSIFYNGIKVHYRPGTEDERVLDHSFEKDIFFKEIPSFRASKDPVIIDVGAHIGTFSLLCASKFPTATLYAYEPSMESFTILEANKDVNALHRLKIFRQAIAPSDGRIKLYHNKTTGNWGHSTTKALSESFEEVDACSLEQVINKNNIDFVDLIKFNCEGAEFAALLDTPQSLLRRIGVGIILYHEDLDTRRGNIDQLSRLFRTLNFRVLLVKKGKDRGWLIVWNKTVYSWLYFIRKALVRRMKR